MLTEIFLDIYILEYLSLLILVLSINLIVNHRNKLYICKVKLFTGMYHMSRIYSIVNNLL